MCSCRSVFQLSRNATVVVVEMKHAYESSGVRTIRFGCTRWVRVRLLHIATTARLQRSQTLVQQPQHIGPDNWRQSFVEDREITVTRIANYFYGRCILRGHVKHTCLRAYIKESDAAFAEAIRTSLTHALYGKECVNVVEQLNQDTGDNKTALIPRVDCRNPRRKHPTLNDVAALYGQRPTHLSTWYLPPCEFAAQWEIALLTHSCA